MIDFLNSFMTVIFKTLILIVNAVLTPIDWVISQYLPAVDSALTHVGSFLTLIMRYMGWAISVSGVSFYAISIIVAYFIFKLSVPIVIWFVKLAVNWYNYLKP